MNIEMAGPVLHDDIATDMNEKTLIHQGKGSNGKSPNPVLFSCISKVKKLQELTRSCRVEVCAHWVSLLVYPHIVSTIPN